MTYLTAVAAKVKIVSLFSDIFLLFMLKNSTLDELFWGGKDSSSTGCRTG